MRNIRRFFDILWYFGKRKILKMKIPLLASFKITYRCNLSCLGCPFHRLAMGKKVSLTWEEATSLLTKLKKTGAGIVIFEGGEPLLWQEGDHTLKDLILYGKKLFSTVGLTTNGTLPFDQIPADVIWVSMDGLKETHDRLRSGSFDRVWENLKNTCHPKVLVHFTVNRENLSDLEPLLEKLKALPTVKGVTVQLFYPYGRGEAPLLLQPSERKKILTTVMELKKRYPIFNSHRGLLGLGGYLFPCHDDVLINVDPDGTVSTGCYARNRGDVHCEHCGFTPIAEASGALDLEIGSLLAGLRTFF